jgi:hypothetical protein
MQHAEEEREYFGASGIHACMPRPDDLCLSDDRPRASPIILCHGLQISRRISMYIYWQSDTVRYTSTVTAAATLGTMYVVVNE